MRAWKYLFGAGLLLLLISAGVPSARAIAQPDRSVARVGQTDGASVARSVSTLQQNLISGDAIANGGFESGHVSWMEYSAGGYNVITTVLPHTGAWGAWFGGYPYSRDSVEQLVTIPSNATLQYWWRIATNGRWCACDGISVALLDTNHQVVAVLDTINVGMGGGIPFWSQRTVNLASYAGQTLYLRFGAAGGQWSTNFYIDDVTLTY